MVPPLNLGALAELIGARLLGEEHRLITGVATLKSAGPGEISFLSNAEYRKDLPSQYRKELSATKASAVIIQEQEAELCPVDKLISPNPRLSLAKALAYFKNTGLEIAGIHPSVVVGEGCQIPASAQLGANVVLGKNVILGEQVSIAPGCVINDNCQIGAHSRLMARVTLYDGVRMGQHCVVYSGAVIGGDGFGFANEKGQWIRLAHLGSVVIGDRVQIGANTTIDRGFLEDTRLEEGVVIDNLVQVGHNATIGKGTAIAGCVAIAGSVSIGQYCLIGGGARIAGHLDIADHVHLTATTGVAHSLHKPGVYGGSPAKPIELWRKNIARFNQLDKMAKRLQVLERHLLNEDEGEKE